MMPILHLGDLTNPADDYRARCQIFAVMAWPAAEDEETRRRYLATVMAHNLGLLSERMKALPDPAEAPDWFETIAAVHEIEAAVNTQAALVGWLDEAGGLVQATTGPGLPGFEKEAASKIGGWFAAGLVLALIRRMATHHADLPGGASVNKAIYMLECLKPPMVPVNSHDLRRAWATFKPVAHLGAALFDAWEREDPCPANPGAPIGGFLADAEAYQAFGLGFVPTRAKGTPILDPKTTWRLPSPPQWDPTPYVPAPLDDELLAALRGYRAPTTY